MVVDPSYTIIQACKEANVYIPRFCFHESLSLAGTCRMCLVEVEGMAKPQIACATQVANKMKINTFSEKTRIARGGVVTFLVQNHPLDCPICDQGGECDLQKVSIYHGYGDIRFNRDFKRAVEDKDIGPNVKTSMNRCIHCTRCIRFTKQIAGEDTLCPTGRGRHKEIGTYVESTLTNELSANIADLCPVGALCHYPSLYRGRPWENQTTNSIDVMDALGSNINIETRNVEIMKILPKINEDINIEWISDKSRNSLDGFRKQRLTMPMKRDSGKNFIEITWQEAFDIARNKFANTKGEFISGIIGKFMDLEAITCYRDLMHKLGSENLDVSNNNPTLKCDFRNEYLMNSRIRGIEDADTLLLVGTNPRTECPVLNARIRRATKSRGLNTSVIGAGINLTYNYNHLGNSTKILKLIEDGTHPYCKVLENSKFPMLLLGISNLKGKEGQLIYDICMKISAKYKIINKSKGWNGFNILHQDASKAGQMELGIIPKRLSDLKEEPKLVYLLGADNFEQSDIPESAFVIYQGFQGDIGSMRADLILPGLAPIEKNCTYVNTEGRPQLCRRTILNPGSSKEDWQIIRALSEEINKPLQYNNIEDVRNRMAELAPYLTKLNYIEPFGFANLKTESLPSSITLNDIVLKDPIDNFYMTDSISRNSTWMARCSKEINPIKLTNFRKDQLL